MSSISTIGTTKILATTNQIVCGVTNTTTLSFPAPSGSITLAFPSTADTIVGQATTDTLTNKNLTNASCFHVDRTDVTKRIGFVSSSATTATTLIIASLQSTSQTLNIPNLTGTDTIATLALAQTLTNKTLTSNTNNVIARELWIGSGSGSVSIYAATAPTSGQILTATSGTTATWQTPSTTIPYTEITSTTTTTTTSSSYVTLNGMTATPASGTYFVSFSGAFYSSNTSGLSIGIFKNSTLIGHTNRNYAGGGAQTSGLIETFHTQAIVTANGTDVIDIRWNNNGSGTATSTNISMELLNIA